MLLRVPGANMVGHPGQLRWTETAQEPAILAATVWMTLAGP